MATSYTAKDILVLEGLEPVRRRPGMYIGGVDETGLHHLVWEIVDNSVDEAMNGHADRIAVTLHKDGASITVSDNGRGIPVDKHPKYKKPALELILTTLHAGGKFEAKNYFHSGGLHGVGASVVTALSENLTATVKRDGAEWEQKFARGVATGPLKKLGAARGSGTTIFFRPDAKIFPKVQLRRQAHRRALEAKAYLHSGLTIDFSDEAADTKISFHYEEGIKTYLGKIIADGGKTPLAGEVFAIAKQQDDLHLECALAWTEETDEKVLSFVNSIPTSAGGTHENGLKSGIVKAVRNYLTVHNLVPRGVTITAEDVREGIVAVLSIKIPQPQFQGQTKERLNNPEVTPVIDGIVRTAARERAERQPHRGRRHRQPRHPGGARAQRVARRRRAGQRKSAISHRLNLPGKLADCTLDRPDECELFIVEGDSAGGSAKQGRERKFQAILPLRGKVLNTEQASTVKVLGNKELADIVSALGCGAGKDFDAEEAALPQDLPADGCRLRRPPHLHAAADLLLPPHARADPAGLRLHRAAAALSRRDRQADALGARRRRARQDPRRR